MNNKLEDEFSVSSLKIQLSMMQDETKRDNLAKLVPSIFITDGDRPDTFALETNRRWTKDKYPRELLPAVREYKTALLRELRTAEYYIRYLQDEGCYPLGNIKVLVTYED